MKTNRAHAVWKGKLKDGNGTMKLGSVDKEMAYNFSSRFENGNDTNPEELIGAAHAGCFSMAFSKLLEDEGFDPQSISTTAEVELVKEDAGFRIKSSHLKTEAEVPGIGDDLFNELAGKAKENCPVSQALASLEITMEATLKKS
jgi:osmotically inducible protein OsmC